MLKVGKSESGKNDIYSYFSKLKKDSMFTPVPILILLFINYIKI
ncbi:hypothetical protein NVIRPANT_00727 [Pantoea sp. Nvir]|nr:hypothetical protein NVIRPANT_00727 [Pantoea sp. Nvir]